MNIREFLTDNYIWIIVVIVLLIITVIGFLFDKKSEPKKPKPVSNGSFPPTNTGMMNYQNSQTPINYQGQAMMTNNETIPNMMPNQTINPPVNAGITEMSSVNNANLNQGINNIPSNNMPNPMPSFNIPNQMNPIPTNANNPMPIENLNSTINQKTESMYQPLSEQVPTFPPREIPPVLQGQPNDNISSLNMSPIQPIDSLNNQPTIQNQSVIPTPMPISPDMNQFQSPMNNNFVLDSNLNSQVVQQPVVEQPVQNMYYSNQQPVNNDQLLNNQPVNYPTNQNLEATPSFNSTIPNPIATPQPVNPQPINFVYGSNSNNNQSM